ncbi:C-terminal binding protein [Cohnella massiliensis]|uniref:C-terminal binding protein n=1 Tax=Cohnella massiliensis TaxID=1816691 RepID=UPI0009B9E182|nr:C-terminal binding protein [Cohnella massiliensis]
MLNGKKLVWILDDEWTDHSVEKAIYEANGFEVKVTTSGTLAEDTALYAPHADGVVAQVGFPCGAELIGRLSCCKSIAVSGVGFNHVDLEAATRQGIIVANVPDYCLEEVSDHAVALMLALSKRLVAYHNQVRAGDWDPLDTLPIYRFRDRTVGLLGFGRISRRVAEKLKGFGVRIVAHDAYVESGVFAAYGVEPLSFEELLQRSDILSLHVPLTPETKELLTYKRMKTMPRGAILVNTCRGGVVREADLRRLLVEGHLAGAGLDVLTEEPPRPNHPLIGLEQTLVTPHSSYVSVESVLELKRRTCQIVIEAAAGKEPANSLNRPA